MEKLFHFDRPRHKDDREWRCGNSRLTPVFRKRGCLAAFDVGQQGRNGGLFFVFNMLAVERVRYY